MRGPITPSRWALEAVDHVNSLSSGEPVDRSLRITLNFHPDRLGGDATTIEAIARDGVYRSQFETGTGNGGLTAHAGGDRWNWEQRLFGGAYDKAPARERPKYGALDHRRRPLGGAPRFGSCYFRLAAHALDRATFCFPDSFTDPSSIGTAARCGDLLAAARSFERQPLAHEPEDGDLLDGYIEAQVHGELVVERDVEAIVCDPCYRGTPSETFARSLGVPVEWHEGRVLDLETLDRNAEYRDPPAVEVAHAIARDGVLDARIIGDAAGTGRHHPHAVKQVWHHVARFGTPRG